VAYAGEDIGEAVLVGRRDHLAITPLPPPGCAIAVAPASAARVWAVGEGKQRSETNPSLEVLL